MGEVNIYRLDVGSCNGCDIEVFSALATRFGLEKLGVKLVDDPSEANVLIITGVPTIKMHEVLKEVRGKLKSPKLAISVGACALSGEAFEGSYSVDGMVDDIIHVDAYVPGCPPSPQAIVEALANVLELGPRASEAPSGFRGMPQLDAEKCTACGACAQVCPTGAIELADEDSERVVKFKYEKCISCAFCEEVCPEEAISISAERPSLTKNRKAIGISGRMGLQRCSVCGKPFAPTSQLQRAADRIVEDVKEFQAYRDLIAQAMGLCQNCRMLPENIRKAKILLFKLDRAV
ncbi:MAG: 4Fe-4S dicluster domain-containing protein [Candidatus Hodarchaeaceae archaeon]|nr:4Fe-4S dicluster domain-containing protein [Candidatus Hodarchaeaceae archaeon]